MKTILFDCETTGLLVPSANSLSKQPYITEIYGLKVDYTDGDFEIIGEFESLVKPPIEISAEITRITGITNELLADQPSFMDIWHDLAKFFMGTERMVAHNLAFDRSMVANELMRKGKVLNFPWPISHICTVEHTLHMEQRRLSLTRLHEELFGCAFQDSHRAKSDVEALYRCYKQLVKDGVIK